MIKTLCTLLMAMITLGSYGQSKTESIIPAPLSVQHMDGNFIFNANTSFSIRVKDAAPVQFFRDYLRAHTQIHVLKMMPKEKNATQIIFTDAETANMAEEGYELTIAPKTITVRAKKAGLFYAIQTLIQLFPGQNATSAVLPCTKIVDRPRFGYRGLMLDVSRHFFTVDEIKGLLDLMAAYKLNRFHWHLTDDQGWRIEIKSFPKLTSVGAWRVPRKDFYGADAPQPGELATDGGFYTQEQVKDVVRYAAARNIQVLPEIDVPGHFMAAIAAYPELSVTKNPDTKVNPGSSFAKWFATGGFEMYVDNTLNPTDEKVYQFLDQVFEEVAALFPYEYIHIGGDECYKGFWEKDAGVKDFMQKKGIKDMHGLQVYFTKRISEIVRSKHKKAIGWDEIDDGALGDGVAIMNRFGEKGALDQAKRKVNLVMAPGGNGLYFDYAQSASEMEPINHGGNDPVWKTYAYGVDYAKMAPEDKSYIQGVQACIWTEGMSSMRKVQYMLLPRMLALAEIGWTELSNKDHGRFADQAMPEHLARFDRLGLNYRIPTAFNYTDTTLVGQEFKFTLKPPIPGSKIFYTLNNRFPSEADHEYTEPITVRLLENKRTVLKTIVVAPSGKRSVVTRTVMLNPAMKKAVSASRPNSGLAYRMVGPSSLKIDTGITDMALEKFRSVKNASLTLEGLIKIAEDGYYEFSTSTKATEISIDGLRLFDSEKPYPRFDKADPVYLEKGYHKFKIVHSSFTGKSEPIIWSRYGDKKQLLESVNVYH
ncbi:MAG: family 20 glycosylhydrolase [Pedobacter sp.]|nr:family 20 glycosylhydrolase [Pedobacter sp.]MDQ8051556.1 family 20 glycosylhydrolase [Pedobacter sp.]